jgi:hypothetical protein
MTLNGAKIQFAEEKPPVEMHRKSAGALDLHEIGVVFAPFWQTCRLG